MAPFPRWCPLGQHPAPPLSDSGGAGLDGFRGPKAIQRFKDENNTHTPRESVLPQTLQFLPLPCTAPLVKPTGHGTVIAYTDGSCIKYPDGRQSIGAAVFFPADNDDSLGTTITINPRGKGPTLTINRAEPVP